MKTLRISWNRAEAWSEHRVALRAAGQGGDDCDDELDRLLAGIVAALPLRSTAPSSDMALQALWLVDC